MGETTVLHLPFVGGIDEKTAKEYLDAASRQASILNGDFVKVGVVDKRNGIEYLPTPLISGGVLPPLSAGTRVVGWSRSSLSILCSTGLYQYVDAPVGGTSNGGVVGVGKLPQVGVLRRQLVTGDQSSAPVLCDLIYSGQLLRISVYWDASYNLTASVYDVDSGNIILEPTQIYECTGTLTDGTIPHVIAAFDLPGIPNGKPRAFIAFQDNVDGAVKFVQYNPFANSFTAPTTLVASADVVDVAPYEDDPANGWFVFYSKGGSFTRLQYWNEDGVKVSLTQTIEASHAMGYGAYVCGRYGQSVWTVWKTTKDTNTYYWAQRRSADTFFTTATAPSIFQTVDTGGTSLTFVPLGTVHLGTDKIFVLYRYHDAGAALPYASVMGWSVLSHSAGVVATWASGGVSPGLLPASRPFVIDGEVYQPFYYNPYYVADTSDASKQVTMYLCKFEGVTDSMPNLPVIRPIVCRPVATAAPRQVVHAFQGYIDFFGGFHVGFASSVLRAATRVAVGIKTLGAVGTLSSAVSGPSWAVDFMWDEDSRRGLYQPSDLGSELSISGGVPFVADGQSAFEDGFFNYPEFSTVVLEGIGTPLATAQYTFAVVYRAVDSAGLVHRSAPYICNPVSVTAGGPGPAVYIPAPIASYRDVFAADDTIGKIYADVYMTTANGSTLYYKDSIVVSNVTNAAGADRWPGSIRYPSTGQVEAPPVTTSQLLYTTGGVMDNVNPPASSVQIVHQKRKALVDETLRGVWFSKQFVEGEAPGFNEALYVPFPEGGDITALASFLGKFFVFKSNSIWYMEGEGPAVTGLGSSWTSPEMLVSDVGCKSWRSVVSTPSGLLFQAPNNGIYLLGQDLQVSFIGKSVVDRTNAYPNIVSATLVPSSNQVRFVCLDEAGENHLVVVYDYLLNAWTTHRYDHISGVPVSVCMSTGTTPRYTVLTADGQVWQERLASDSQRYLDQDNAEGLHFVPTVVKVPFVKLQVQGYHRARRVQFFGERLDDCGLQIQMAFNYDDTVRQTAKWAASQLDSLSVKGQVEAYVGAAFNKQMSMQLTFSDTAGPAMTTGAGMRFVSAAIELQNLGSRYKLLGAGARR